MNAIVHFHGLVQLDSVVISVLLSVMGKSESEGYSGAEISLWGGKEY